MPDDADRPQTREELASGARLLLEMERGLNVLLSPQTSKTMIQRIEAGPRMSEATIHNGVVYLAGQIPSDATAGIEDQTRQVLAEIDALLAQVGTDKTRILRAQIFLADIADFAGMNRAWDQWVVPGHTPARATVEAKLADPAWKIEIVVTAALA